MLKSLETVNGQWAIKPLVVYPNLMTEVSPPYFDLSRQVHQRTQYCKPKFAEDAFDQSTFDAQQPAELLGYQPCHQ